MLHVQVNSLSEDQKNYVRNRIIATRPDTVLIMNSFSFAISLKPYVKNVIYRDWALRDENNVWSLVSAQEWLNSHREAGNAGLWLYAENEAALSTEAIEWLYQVALGCIQRGWKVVLGNWAVGNPHHLDIYRVHHILQLANDYPQYVTIGLHEYIPTLTTERYGKITDRNQWNNIQVPNSDLPWHIGRFRWWVKYGKEHNLKFNIAITEYGFDEVEDVHEWQKTVPGYKYAMGLNNCLLAFSAWGGNAIDYAIASLYWAWDNIYYPFSDWIMGDPCIFTVAGNAWEDFDLLNTNILDKLVKFKVKPSMIEGTTLQTVRIEHPQEYINVRSDPTTSATAVGRIYSGDVISIYIDSDATANGLRWKRTANDTWFAQVPGLTITPVTNDAHSMLTQIIADLQIVLDMI